MLDLQLALLAIGLEIDGGNDVVADQHRQGEVAEHPLLLGHVGLEAVLVVEEQLQPLALDDERVEGGEDMHQLLPDRGIASSASGRDPVLHFPAPSSVTGTSSLRRTLASINRRMAGLRLASRWQTESRLTIPCARSARSSR